MTDGPASGPPPESDTAAEPRVVPLPYVRPDPGEARAASEAFLGIMSTRRSVRQFSTEPVPVDLVVNAIATARTAPSDDGAEPWTFVAVSNADVKRRLAAKAGDSLSEAPYLIVVFEHAGGPGQRTGDLGKAGVGIACGLLLASLHMAGLATLVQRPPATSTLNKICGRPREERAGLIVAAGYPTEDAVVRERSLRPLGEILYVVP